MTSNERYWLERMAQLEALSDNRCRITFDEIGTLYDGALTNIDGRIRKIFERFVKGYSLTPEQATALLTAVQTKEARAVLQQMFDAAETDALREEIRAKLDAPAYQYRISKLEALRDQVYFDARAIAEAETKYQTARLIDLYQQGYYRTTFALSQKAGYNVPFQTISDKRAAQAVYQYWSADLSTTAKNFSERVWGNTEELAQNVREIVTQGFLTGESYQDMMQELTAAMGRVEYRKQVQADGSTRQVLTGSGAKYRAARLIRTEGNHITGQATLASYRDAGITRYIYRSLLEVRTCKVCGGLDGKDFPIAEQQVGVNMHPMHPQCRCFTIPYESVESLRRFTRSAQTAPDKWESVPASMTYQEWYAKYVAGNGEMEVAEKMTRNKAEDEAQFARYQAVLGDSAPKTLAEFQKLKYTESERWKFTQLDYSRRNELLQHPELALPNAEQASAPEAKFTKYLFSGAHENGLAKGRAFTSRLGYDIQNWKALQAAIVGNAGKYPVTNKGTDQYGTAYEQKMVLYGTKGTPANVIVGWKLKPDGTVSMSSAYIKEVK